ncbi:MAG: lipid-A-disaccharide synthase N-terminal domain-containing protein [Candidatus Micrarchaeota archaeon]|nr:lipid-A-disaccharide synthase N-terminal domain-containing protein [Candidatus Micrarchaeota archaeon]
MFELAGIIGMIFIVLAWIPQTIKTIKTKTVGIEPKFLWLYMFGCIGLILYSVYISDPIFIGLNSISLVFNLVNIYYCYKYPYSGKNKINRR